ncbi:MAG: hypothetical protein JXR95_05495 [Deltaproteobacteria bacterium]|nr:hypothetical protein [Deltaproteobacteria bacterium]
MNRLLAIVLVSVVFTWGCSDPCEKAVKKAQSCLEKEGKKENKADPPVFLQICKQNRDKFKKCLSINDCVKYRECISKAGTDEKAEKELNKSDSSEKEEKKTDKVEAKSPEKSEKNTESEPKKPPEKK